MTDHFCPYCKCLEHKDIVLSVGCSVLIASLFATALAQEDRQFVGAGVALNSLHIEGTTTTTAIDYERKVEPSPSRARRIVSYGVGILHKIMMCESGGNPTAQNPTSSASGLFQVITSTWGNYAGYARAMYAPVAVQWRHARELFALAGTRPWAASRSCWA